MLPVSQWHQQTASIKNHSLSLDSKDETIEIELKVPHNNYESVRPKIVAEEAYKIETKYFLSRKFQSCLLVASPALTSQDELTVFWPQFPWYLAVTSETGGSKAYGGRCSASKG